MQNACTKCCEGNYIPWYVIPPTSADIAIYAGQGEGGIAQVTETESCRLIAGCSSTIEKARKKNSTAICQAGSSNLNGGTSVMNIKCDELPYREGRCFSANSLRTYGIDFYQLTAPLQGDFTAQGGSGTLRWIKYPP